jgi:hypothetical protein
LDLVKTFFSSFFFPSWRAATKKIILPGLESQLELFRPVDLSIGEDICPIDDISIKTILLPLTNLPGKTYFFNNLINFIGI